MSFLSCSQSALQYKSRFVRICTDVSESQFSEIWWGGGGGGRDGVSIQFLSATMGNIICYLEPNLSKHFNFF